MPAEGNHESCGFCLGVPELPRSAGNMTEYKLRFHSTSLYAGANSGSNNNRYYSFNQGLTHFIVFTAEAYIYARDDTFLANQVAFMAADLAAVDRAATPWVVALVHKDWTMETEAFSAFTPILDKGGVDVLFCGHVCLRARAVPPPRAWRAAPPPQAPSGARTRRRAHPRSPSSFARRGAAGALLQPLHAV